MKEKLIKRIERLEKQMRKIKKDFNQYVDNHSLDGNWRKEDDKKFA